jgi:hypothetical protein
VLNGGVCGDPTTSATSVDPTLAKATRECLAASIQLASQTSHHRQDACPHPA